MKVPKYQHKLGILLITAIIFSFSWKYEISTLIVMSLSFLTLLEIVRAIYEYVMINTHRIKMRYLIDGSIVYGLRELYLGWVMIKPNPEKGLLICIISIILIGILIYYRKKIIEASPDVLEKG